MVALRSLLVSFAVAAATVSSAAPVKIIFDTDIGNDVDDVLALGMIHALQTRGACELLAVTLTKDHPQAAAFVDAINTFYGRPGIPIGVVHRGATPDAGKFNRLADEQNTDGTLRYPHRLKSGAEAPEAVGLLRKILAAQPDGSVSLVQVGFFTNCARLLDSRPDEFSPLNGRDLVRAKVKVLSVMAGAFQTVNGNTRYLEYNVIKDIPAAQKLAREWPTSIVWSGFEIGIAAPYPHESIERDFNYLPHHPLKEAYVLYNPPPHDRPTWDLTSALWAILPDRGYFDLSPTGKVVVDDTGSTWFTTAKDGKGRDRYLVLDALKVARLREAFVQLCTAPK
ncbi:MAG: nucleoside hydrolase [Verrucomicrobia bacterium]|nr:nucleoside hydrolase [Verrucomicrobiota bacterium]